MRTRIQSSAWLRAVFNSVSFADRMEAIDISFSFIAISSVIFLKDEKYRIVKISARVAAKGHDFEICLVPNIRAVTLKK
jgi:hypothetical protein